MIVFFTVAFLISLYLIAASLLRGLMVAGFFSTWMAVFFGLCICTFIPHSFSDKTREFIGSVFEEKKAQEQNSNQKRETEWVCTIVDDQKICTRNQEKEAHEDETSEWDCVTEGNRKICIKHGAEK